MGVRKHSAGLTGGFGGPQSDIKSSYSGRDVVCGDVEMIRVSKIREYNNGGKGGGVGRFDGIFWVFTAVTGN